MCAQSAEHSYLRESNSVRNAEKRLVSNMNKEFNRYLPIWCILTVVPNVILWVIDLDRSNGFYAAYFAANIALLIQLGISYYALAGRKVTAANIMMESIIGLMVLIIVNIYIVYSAYIDPVLGNLIPEIRVLGFLLRKADTVKLLVVVDIIILAVNYITVILLGQHSDRIEERDRHVIEKTAVMRQLVAKAKTVAETRNDAQLKKIYEELRYSKNISSETGLACANRIDELLTRIETADKNLILTDEIDEVLALIRKLNNN